MTENEALKTLEDLQRLLTNYRHISKDLTEANGIAIKALEEIQAYRAIGTVEDIEKSMKNVSVLLAEHEMLKLYQSIGTIEEFMALKEKMASKKVVAISLTHEGRVGNCPNCNNFVAENYDKKCPKCRRELDWS